MKDAYQKLVSNIIAWGEICSRLYAAVIIGSHARSDHQADEYSDLDIIMIVDEPDYFLSSDQWLNDIGEYHISFVENTIGGEKERRVLFELSLDVDFIILPQSSIKALTSEEGATILGNGFCVIIDKIGLQDIITPPSQTKQTAILPTEQEFINIVNDFWYHCVWAVKKLQRGELWTAKFCIDYYMKCKLLSIIEHHALAMHGLDYNTWHDGRFIEEWAEKWIIEKLSRCFAYYDKADIKAALHATMDLFRVVAIETAEMLNFKYPQAADQYSYDRVQNGE